MTDAAPEFAAILDAIADDDVVDDDLPDLFSNVPPEWRRLTEVALSHFSLDDLPRLFRPAAPVALNMLALKLAEDPAASRAGLVELIAEAIAALGITRDELPCWDIAGLPYLDAPATRARVV